MSRDRSTIAMDIVEWSLFAADKQQPWDLINVIRDVRVAGSWKDGMPSLRIRVPLNPTDPDESWLPYAARDIAEEAVTMLLSECTNNDACDVVIRQRSAHLHLHEDLEGWYGGEEDEIDYLIVDAEVLDYLS